MFCYDDYVASPNRVSVKKKKKKSKFLIIIFVKKIQLVGFFKTKNPQINMGEAMKAIRLDEDGRHGCREGRYLSLRHH